MPVRIRGALLFLFIGVQAAWGQGSRVTDADIRHRIIDESIHAYLATGHPCACPYNVARNGSRCGARSAYSRRGGAEPLCYPKDVSDDMVKGWRHSYAE